MSASTNVPTPTPRINMNITNDHLNSSQVTTMARAQSVEEAYAEPSHLEIEVRNAQTHGFGRTRFTDYEVCVRVCSRCCF